MGNQWRVCYQWGLPRPVLFIVAYEKYVSVSLRAARTLLKRYRIFSKVTVVMWSQIIKNMAVFGIYS